ncbi:MAG TPA: polysulfide reductase NrfD [Candidatus Gordonibacter avicola]|nr:polysulfide reductase NrfD [Candidatus Gordonibacter avicola]
MNIAIGVAAVVTVIGIALWVFQLTSGMVNTNMRNLDSWGLYITMFMFLVGLSAGGLIISSVPRAFGMEGFGGISKVAVWTSICCTVLAIGFVVVDLGQPLRLWELFAYSNLGSPLMWDIIVLAVYLILSIVYLWATLRAEAGKVSNTALRVVSVFALVCAVLVHSVTAWIFGLQQGREMWHTALLGPWFVSSALVCGTALVLMVVIALRRAGYLELDQKNVVKMVKMLGAFVCVDLYFFGCDLLTEAFPAGSGADLVAMLTTGALAPFFWIEIIGCAFAAVVAFMPALRRNGLIVVAAVLAIVGIFCKRVQLLVGGFQIPNLDMPAVASGPGLTDAGAALQGAGGAMVYFPAPLEFGVMLGVVGLGALLLLLGLKFLPLRPVSASH